MDLHVYSLQYKQLFFHNRSLVNKPLKCLHKTHFIKKLCDIDKFSIPNGWMCTVVIFKIHSCTNFFLILFLAQILSWPISRISCIKSKRVRVLSF